MKKPNKTNQLNFYVGKRLRSLRQLRGDSQESLGDQIGVTFQQVQKYENGFNGLTYSRAYDIAKIYKVPVAYFSEGFEENLAVGDIYYDVQPFKRTTKKAAQIINDISDTRVQKALLVVLTALVPEGPQT